MSLGSPFQSSYPRTSSPQAAITVTRSSSPTLSTSSSSPTNAPTRRKWSEDESKCLLQIWAKYHGDLKKKRNKAVWEKIANEFNATIRDIDSRAFGQRDMCQIKIKIKNLTDAYKEAKAKKCKSGNGRETSP